ncbi:choice-of-anchor D domain-containing protein [Methylomagnum sp.]
MLRAAVFSGLLILGITKAQSAEDLSNILGLIRAAPENTWIKMNTNKFSDAWVPKELRPPYPSHINPGTIINAWSSFAWDSNRGDLLIFGGGHANYSGNEVYRWRGSTQEWERASLPSALDPTTLIPEGDTPQSSHTYDNSVFLPKADRFVTFGGAAFQTGSGFFKQNPDGSFARTGPFFFDPAKANPNEVGGPDGTGVNPNTPGGTMWQNRDHALDLPSSVMGTTDYAYQDGKEVIYVSGPNGGGFDHTLVKYTVTDPQDPSQDTWEIVGINWIGSGSHGAGAYDPVRNIYVKTLWDGAPFTFWDIDQAGPGNRNRWVQLTSVPSSFSIAEGKFGMEYDPVRDRFLLWGGGGNVYQLNIGNRDGTDWTLSELPLGMNTVMPPDYVARGGVLGKWHYAPNLDVFVGLEGPNEGNVWFFKPSGWIDPGPAAPAPELALGAIAPFGNQTVTASGAAQHVILKNVGAAAYSLQSIATTGDFAVTHNCGASLPAGQSCTLQITFSPTAIGVQTGNLTLTGADSDPLVSPLSGTGIESSTPLASDPPASPQSGTGTGNESSMPLASTNLAIKTTAPKSAPLGKSVAYRFIITNETKKTTAPAVIVTGQLSDGGSYTQVPAFCGVTGPTLTCQLNDLAPKKRKAFTVKAKPSGKGKLTFVASVTGNVSDPKPVNNTVTVSTTVK